MIPPFYRLLSQKVTSHETQSVSTDRVIVTLKVPSHNFYSTQKTSIRRILQSVPYFFIRSKSSQKETIIFLTLSDILIQFYDSFDIKDLKIGFPIGEIIIPLLLLFFTNSSQRL